MTNFAICSSVHTHQSDHRRRSVRAFFVPPPVCPNCPLAAVVQKWTSSEDCSSSTGAREASAGFEAERHSNEDFLPLSKGHLLTAVLFDQKPAERSCQEGGGRRRIGLLPSSFTYFSKLQCERWKAFFEASRASYLCSASIGH